MSLSDVNPPMARPSTTTLVGHTVARMTASVALIFLVVSGNFMAGPPIFHWIPLVILTVTGILGWIAVALYRGRLDAELLAAATVPSVAVAITASLSAYPSLSWDSAWHLSTLAGTALLVWYALARWGPRDFVVVLGSLLVLLVAGYLLQVVLAYQTWLSLGMSAATLPLRPLNAGSLALIPTWLSDYVILLAPVMVVIFARAGRGGRWMAAALAVASVAVVIIGGTRSLWLLTAAVAGGLFIAWLWHRPHGRVLVGIGVVVGLLASIAFALALGGRVARSLDEGRLSAFGSAVAQFVRSPIFGTGPGTYGEYRLGYSVQYLEHLAFPNSHNVVLSTAAEEGLLGVLALAIVVACCLVVLRRRWREPDRDTVLLVAAGAGIVVVLGHALVDVVIDVPGIMVCLMVVAGIALVRPSPPKSVTPGPGVGRSVAGHRMPAALAAIGVLVLVLTGALASRFEVSLVRQVQADGAVRGDPGAALTAAVDAASLTPDSTPAWNAIAVAADRAGRLDEAIVAVRHMIALEPFAQHQAELAILLDRSGDSAGAIQEMRSAAADQRDPFVQLNAAILLSKYGLRAEAERAATQLIVLQPLIGIQRSALPAGVQSLWADATAAAIPQLEAAGQWDDALAAALLGNLSLAPGVVAASPVARRAILADVEAAWGGSAASRTAVEHAARADPSDTTCLRGHGAWRRSVAT